MKNIDSTIISFINLALVELASRFNLKTKATVIRVEEDVYFYELREDDLVRILNIQETDGSDLKFPTVNKVEYDVKGVNYDSFLLVKPTKKQLVVVYQATIPKVTSASDYIRVQPFLITPILQYVAYKAHTSISGKTDTENNVYFQRYELAIRRLIEDDLLGYPKELIKKHTQVSGFI